MKKKLFENINGNTFKLITEGIDEVNPNAKLVREGLKKVFGAGDKQLSYKKLQGVGLGYIKSVEEAKKTAIREARELAKEYGYMDNENAQEFVKENEPGDMTVPPRNGESPEESQEVKIGNNIKVSVKALRDLLVKKGYSKLLRDADITNLLDRLEANGTMLVSMHTQ
jgi:hypothetical protein